MLELGKWIAELKSRRVVIGTLSYGSLEVFSRAVQSGAILLFAQQFSKAQFGNFYTNFAVYQLVAAISVGGLTELLISGFATGATVDSPDRSHLLRPIFRALLGRAVIACVSIAVFGLEYRGNDGHHLDYMILAEATAAGLGYGFVTLMSSYLNCAGRDRQAILLRSAYLISSYGLAIEMVTTGHTLDSFFVGFCIVGALVAALVALKRLTAARTTITTGSDDHVSTRSAWFLVPALLNWFFWYGLVIFVSAHFGAASAADLAFTNNISAVLLIINTAISQAWISNYLRHHQVSRVSAEIVNVRVFKIQSALMLLVTVVMIATYSYFLSIHFPIIQKYGKIGIDMAIVLFSLSVSSNYFSAINSFAINQKGKRLAVLSMAAYCISILFLLVAVHLFGVLGVYLGLALLFMSRGFLITYDALRSFGAGFFDVRLMGANALAFVVVICYFQCLAR